MSNIHTLQFRQGVGSIIGTYINVEYGDKIKSISAYLGHGSAEFGMPSAKGRFVTAAYWVVDSEFDRNKIILTANSANVRYCNNIESNLKNHILTVDGQSYVNTNLIDKDKIEEFTFNFEIENDTGVNSNKIFFAFISTPESENNDIYDVNESSLTIGSVEGGSYYYRKSGGINADTQLQCVNSQTLAISRLDVEHINSTGESSTSIKPSKIACSEIRYRTLSQSGTNTQNGWSDGGETYSHARDLNNVFRNENNAFKTDFDFDEGRLKDIIFHNPSAGSYVANGLNEPRWVFKRSRIRFTIPPVRNVRNEIQKTPVTIRYKIEAKIYDKNAYRNGNPVYIDLKDNSSNPDGMYLFICPRDEGILDNSEFTITIDRCYTGSSTYSDPVTYYFRTYQKPIVNIAYPKMIRNKATGNGYKHAKILTSNMYSNFKGENAIVNKYVCDALNLFIASPKPDASGIPFFVRFHVAEYRFGRNGCLNDNNELDESKFNTALDVFKSANPSDYTTADAILNDTAIKTAYMTGINNCDGAPILLSGRLTDKNIEELITSSTGQQLQLWTYRKWDYVVDKDNDIQVGNAYEYTTHEHDSDGEVRYRDDARTDKITNKNSSEWRNGYPKDIVITESVIGDHCGAAEVTEWYDDGDAKSVVQNPSTMLLFRAGYVYLIKVRIFHGAAAGAIGKKYGNINPTIYGYGENSIYKNSGKYEYSLETSYDGDYPYIINNNNVILDDISQYGKDNPYKNPNTNKNWVGPEDGTSGITLDNDRINQTYPGFSEVDYSLLEPICPYTSTSNLVTVHPTSPQIGANQWLTFNYRHLAKNIGGIDTYAVDSNNKLQNNSFGKTHGGVSNTVSRIMDMYTSCVETILNNFCVNNRINTLYKDCWLNQHDRNTTPTLMRENITLYIKPVNERLNHSDNNYTYMNSHWKPANIPLINNYDCLNKSFSDITDTDFYNSNSKYEDNNGYEQTGESGCYAYNIYRLNSNTLYDYSEHNYNSWPETQIIYLSHNQNDMSGTTAKRKKLIEPLGNTYRWRPVINAMKSNTEEIKIEDQFSNKLIEADNNLKSEKGTFKNTNEIILKYNDDIQTKYYYNDNTIVGDMFTNTFTINEFAGVTTDDSESSGWPAMYTSAAIDKGSYSDNHKYIKYFAITSNPKSYGNLFTRVPSSQDCENGNILSHVGAENYTELPNTGGIVSKVHNEQPNIDDNFNNIYPLVRTTHYLYFKTWINTSFCMKVDLEIECEKLINGKLESSTINSTVYFDGQSMQDSEAIIKFGNDNGLSQVYGEDNNGWGRCLTADDVSARRIKYDGDISKKTESGGIEVPIMVRYTPLIQPQIATETINTKNETLLLDSSSKIVTIKSYRNYENNTDTIPVINFINAKNNQSTLMKITGYNLNIYYPYIAENNTYHTVSPNGGNSNNVYYENYYIDVDTDTSKSLDLETSTSNNLDFLGGYGICTSYMVLLVPSDPDISNITLNEKQYFKNTDGHWNYYKQPANYYSGQDVFNIRSKSVTTAGTVLVAYRVGPDIMNSIDYLSDDYVKSIPTDWKADENVKGRCFKSLKLNFKNLIDGKILTPKIVNNEYKTDESISIDEFNNKENNIKLTSENTLKPGLTYDLVIVPIYDNSITKKYNYNEGTANYINNYQYYGGGKTDELVTFFGSNPMVSFNYLQIANSIEADGFISTDSGDTDIPEHPDPEDPNPDTSEFINDNDHAIIFPNVDNELFNIETGVIKECPGFWLNNSFKLILRMPSFRTNSTKLDNNDLNTVESLSNGLINDANDFLFSDIQIHIGKIEELKNYGYPYEMDTELNTITSKERLAALHIISYKDYWNKGVFSKKLSNDENDGRSLLTGGALLPTNSNYSNRFIEVNLSNAEIMDDYGNMVPIYTLYPEGYYIQFRWKSAYSAGNNSSQWSDWHGGSCDGGKNWWGDKGLSYYVPIRNYSDVHTEFRNYIKESYPGSLINTKCDENENNEIDFKYATIGKGSYSVYGNVDKESMSNPKNATYPGYYQNGLGNSSNSEIVPGNSDNIYKSAYELTHDKNFTIPENITNLHQTLWEMLYIDYIIHNMCKLYYKPKHNDVYTETYNNKSINRCHLTSPRINNISYIIDNFTPEWKRNRYYRQRICKTDFEHLNNQLKSIVEFTRNTLFTGEHINDPILGNVDVLLKNEDSLYFDISERLLIGNKVDSEPGLTKINNVNHTMMSSNYIQNIWQNILSMINTDNNSKHNTTKTDITLSY